MDFVLGTFSNFYIAITYSNSTLCGAWTTSFCEFTENFGNKDTPMGVLNFCKQRGVPLRERCLDWKTIISPGLFVNII